MTRRPLPALFGALGVLAFLVIRDLLGFFLTLASWASNRIENFGEAFPTLLQYLGSQLPEQVLFSAGVFICWWLLLPITASIGLASVIVRGIMAAFAGGLTAFLGGVIVWLIGQSGVRLPNTGSLYDLLALGRDPGMLAFGQISTVVALVPLTVLAAVLVREWSRSKVATSPEVEPAEAV